MFREFRVGYSKSMTLPGYKYLRSYQLTVIIYDLTVEFVRCWINPKSRTQDQMEQYEDFLRQRKLKIWDKEDSRIREFRELKVFRDPPNSPKTPILPDNPEAAANLLITLIHQTQFLLSRQMTALEEKFVKEGGFTENLFKKRLEERNKKQ